MQDEDRQGEAIEAITAVISDILLEEGITQALLDFVDLEVEYTPVLAIRGETLRDAAKVTKTMGGKYIVDHPLIQHSVDADGLKVMRLRYLLALKKEQSVVFGGIARRFRERERGI